MTSKTGKTNAIRQIENKQLYYRYFAFEEQVKTAQDMATLLNEPAAKVFKTLVTVSNRNSHYVFMVPSDSELDLKKAAAVVGEKSVRMIASQELFPLTGYIHGGCSPVGMKRSFITVIDSSCEHFIEIYFSAGRPGCQVLMRTKALIDAFDIGQADIVKA
ncbi:aminoacyl-tRNA deacylase [Yersinia enterocolitica]